MSDRRMLACMICGKVPEAAIPDDVPSESPIRTPYGATLFYTGGHYGSTFWDSFDGEQVAISICDEHLRELPPERIAFLRIKRLHPTRYEEFNPNANPPEAA